MTGIPTYVSELSKHLSRSLDVTGYAITWRGRKRLRAVSPPSWNVPAAYRCLVPVAVAERTWPLFRLPPIQYWVTRKQDVVHATNYQLPPTWGVPALVSVHDLAALDPDSTCPLSEAALRQVGNAVSYGAHFHVATQAVADDLGNHFALPAERITVIPHGPPAMAPVPEASTKQPGPPYFLVLGTVVRRKRIPWIIQTFDRVADAFPTLRLKIAGSANPSDAVDSMWAAKQSARHGSRIDILGYVSPAEKRDLLEGATGLVMASSHEGFGFPILEAFSTGVPVIATNGGAMAEVAGTAALLVDPSSQDDAADCMQLLMKDESVGRRLAQAGAERLDAFSWDRSARMHADLYATLSQG